MLCARISGVLALSVASEQLSGSHLYARVCGGNDLPSFIIAMLLINIICLKRLQRSARQLFANWFVSLADYYIGARFQHYIFGHGTT